MSENRVKTRIVHKHAFEIDWEKAENFIPFEGEYIVYDAEIDKNKEIFPKALDENGKLPKGRTEPYPYARFKIGDGYSNVEALSFQDGFGGKADETIMKAVASVKPAIRTITLDASKWEEITSESNPNFGYYCQTVTIDNITNKSRIDLQPDAKMLAEFKDLHLAFSTENTNGVVVVNSVGNKPSDSYTIQIAVVETELSEGQEKVIGIPVGMPTVKADWEQADPTKADFIKNKPSIPAKTSDLENDSGFITNAVNDLVNYYKKSDTYTKEEINERLSAIPKFAIEVVDELPTAEISDTTIYLKTNSEENNNLYEEYIYVNGKWELLGAQTIDLTNLKTNRIEISDNYTITADDNETFVVYTTIPDPATDTTTPLTMNNISLGNGYRIKCKSTGRNGSLRYARAVQEAGGIVEDADGNSITAPIDYNTAQNVYVRTGQMKGSNSFAAANGSALGHFNVAIGMGAFATPGKDEISADPDNKGGVTIGYQSVGNKNDTVLLGSRNYAIDYHGALSLGFGNRFEVGSNYGAGVGIAVGSYNDVNADVGVTIGVYNKMNHYNTFGLGTRIETSNSRQVLLGIAPDPKDRGSYKCLFAIGDGSNDGTAKHNAFYIYQNESNGRASMAYLNCGLGIGNTTVSNGLRSFGAIAAEVYHDDCFVGGGGLKTTASKQALFGYNNDTTKDCIFAVGNGSSYSSGRHNIFEICRDNKVNINDATFYVNGKEVATKEDIGGGLHVSDTAPENPTNGMLWVDTSLDISITEDMARLQLEMH